MSIEYSDPSKIEQQKLEQKELDKPQSGNDSLDFLQQLKIEDKVQISLEDNGSKKIEQQQLEQNETDKPQSVNDSLDFLQKLKIEDKKAEKELTQNLETSAKDIKANNEVIESVKPNQEGKESLEKGMSINNLDWKNIEKSELKAVDQPKGQFDFSKDEQGRVTCVEGWLKKTNEPRSNEEKGFQKELQEKAPKDDKEKALYNSSHIVPHELGGKGKDNLVLMPERINKSFVRSIEQELGKQLESAPTDKGVYLKASLAWGESKTAPEKIRYEAFVENTDGSLQKVHDSMTKINRDPNEIKQTLAQTLKVGEVNQNTKQWSSQELPEDALLH